MDMEPTYRERATERLAAAVAAYRQATGQQDEDILTVVQDMVSDLCHIVTDDPYDDETLSRRLRVAVGNWRDEVAVDEGARL